MKRKIENYLQEWKSGVNRKPLLLRGARQVGKTYVVDKFGSENFDTYLKVNLERDTDIKDIFKSRNPRQIVRELSAIKGISLTGESLLFIDEIQVSAEAIVSLRYFYEELPELYVIAAGSLIDHTLNDMSYSMPVGRIEYAYLYPLSFDEFLLALGEEALSNYIEQYDLGQEFSTAIHNRMKKLLKLYFFIGGMPEAVKVFAQTNDLLEVEKVLINIITSLQFDFAKYGTRKEQGYLKECLNYSALNVGKKVKYSAINANVQAKYIKAALLKLELSRIVHLVRRAKSSKVPLNQYMDKGRYKLIFLDIGLSRQIANIRFDEIDRVLKDYKGALTEQFVGQELLLSFYEFEDGQLYYWARESKSSNAEIDFLVQLRNEVCPVEVKSGKSGTMKSLHVFLAEKNIKKAIRFDMNLPIIRKELKASTYLKKEKAEVTYELVSLPIYMVSKIKKL